MAEEAASPGQHGAGPFSPDYWQANEDLMWLDLHGAVAGVHEILRERRRQVEHHGYKPGDDDHLVRGELIVYGHLKASEAVHGTFLGYGGPEHSEEKLRQAAALFAAEIDRLGRMLEPGETISYDPAMNKALGLPVTPDPRDALPPEWKPLVEDNIDRDPVVMARPSDELVRDLGGDPKEQGFPPLETSANWGDPGVRREPEGGVMDTAP